MERLFANRYLTPEVAKSVWFKAIRIAVGAEDPITIEIPTTSKKRVFDSVKVTSTSLDRRSLMLADDTFDRLLQKATEPENWSACQECPSKLRCPFKSNRDWLADQALRKNVGTLLLHAELFDGQVMVLREALAVISLLLAGCPHDYSAGKPCAWVHDKLAAGDVFSLASRRLYMVLFSAYSPMGIEPDARDQSAQQKALAAVAASLGPNELDSGRAMITVLDTSRWPSSDVGAQRLLGKGRTLSMLDPFSDVIQRNFADRWDESWLALQGGGVWISQLETDCFACWADLQKAAASSADSIPSSYRWLTRWITAFTVRAGALVEGATTFNDDLNALVSVLQIVGRPNKEQLEVVRKIEKTLTQSLDQQGKGISISSAASLRGQWKDDELKPFLVSGNGSEGSNVVQFKFGKTSGVKQNSLTLVRYIRFSLGIRGLGNSQRRSSHHNFLKGH